MKICVYGIAKDEQKHVDRFMDSTEGADLVVVGCDPGDTTGDLLEARGAIVPRIDLKPFRFDTYRNRVLQTIPHDVDVCVSLDMDEVLPEGWRKKIEDVWEFETTKLNYYLQWCDDRKFRYDRIHARHGMRWVCPNHECVVSIEGNKESLAYSDLTVVHLRDEEKDRSKNLPLLEYAHQEDPNDYRTLWYLGREYYYEEQFSDAISTFYKYFEFNVNPHDESWARIFASRCYYCLGSYQECLAWLDSAIRSAPDLRDAYYEMAIRLREKGKNERAIQELDMALSYKENPFYLESGPAYDSDIYMLRADCHRTIGNKDLAEADYQKALRIDPTRSYAQYKLDIL